MIQKKPYITLITFTFLFFSCAEKKAADAIKEATKKTKDNTDKNKKIVLCKEDIKEIYDNVIKVLDALQKQSEKVTTPMKIITKSNTQATIKSTYENDKEKLKKKRDEDYRKCEERFK